MAYLDLHNVGENSDFIKIVKIAIIKKADEVAKAEPGAETETVFNKRLELAKSVFQNLEVQTRAFSMHVATYGGDLITVSIDEYGIETLEYTGNQDIDTAIDGVIGLIWDIRAGISTVED